MQVKLENVILSTPFLFEASAFDANSEAKFSAHFLIEKGSKHEKQMVEAIKAEAVKKWGAKAEAKLKAINAAGKVWCLRDGDGKVNKEGDPSVGYGGRMYVSAKNKSRPAVVDETLAPVDPADGKLYSGCIVNARIDVRVNDRPSDQVYAYLQVVQRVGDGERLGGGNDTSLSGFEAIPQAEGEPKGDAASLFG